MRPQGALIEAEVLWHEGLHGLGTSLPQRLHHEPGNHQVAGGSQIHVEVVPGALDPEVQGVPSLQGCCSSPPLVVRDVMGHVVSSVVDLVGGHQVIL